MFKRIFMTGLLATFCSMNLQASQAPAGYDQGAGLQLLGEGYGGVALVELTDGPIKQLKDALMDIMTADDCTDANASDRVTAYMTDARGINWCQALNAKYAADKDYALKIPGLVCNNAITFFQLYFRGYATPLWLLIEWMRANKNLSPAKLQAFFDNAGEWNSVLTYAFDELDDKAPHAVAITWLAVEG